MNIKSALQKAALFVKESRASEVFILHHNDTDGLTSGAILAKAFDREGYHIHRGCLEKPYPEIVEKIIRDSSSIFFVFADFASGMIEELKKFNCYKKRILILDHHAVIGTPDDVVHLVNPLQFGLKGEECSASALAFHFALALNPWNEDLAGMGALGAIGDGFVRNGKLLSLNNEAWQVAVKVGVGKEPNFLFPAERDYQAEELASAVDCLGSIAYFRGGPDIAVKGLSDRDYYGMTELAKPFQKELSDAFEDAVKNIPRNETEHFTWFDLGESFSKFGVKSVGLFCQYLRDKNLVDDSKYIVGFQPVPKEIPGLGYLSTDITKISMRVPSKLKKEVEEDKLPDLTKILPVATLKLGGFVDACHPFAAATTIPRGAEKVLIIEMESYLSTK